MSATYLAADYSPTGLQSRHTTEGWAADEEPLPINDVGEGPEAEQRRLRASELRIEGNKKMKAGNEIFAARL